jgi:hypothetical protein
MFDNAVELPKPRNSGEVAAGCGYRKRADPDYVTFRRRSIIGSLLEVRPKRNSPILLAKGETIRRSAFELFREVRVRA